MTFKKKLQPCLLATFLFLGLSAALTVMSTSYAIAAPDISGVKIADSVEVAGSNLVLNGAGIRYRTIFKVYTAALYTSKKASSAEDVYAAPGAKRLIITLLRDIDSKDFGKSFTKGFTNNAPKAEMSKHIPGLVRMGQIFAEQKKLVAGDTIVVDWIPNTGTVISVKGVVQGAASKEPEFYNGFLSIWLGPNPPDFQIKDALLGKAS